VCGRRYARAAASLRAAGGLLTPSFPLSHDNATNGTGTSNATHGTVGGSDWESLGSASAVLLNYGWSHAFEPLDAACAEDVPLLAASLIDGHAHLAEMAVALRDAHDGPATLASCGAACEGAGGEVLASLVRGPPGCVLGSLSGNTTARLGNAGVARFSDLSVSSACGGEHEMLFALSSHTLPLRARVKVRRVACRAQPHPPSMRPH
jgi:hypothetical protein